MRAWFSTGAEPAWPVRHAQSSCVEIARFVQFLSGRSLGTAPSCFADPSIGTGSFYSAALTVFGTEQIERAVGVEATIPAFLLLLIAMGWRWP